MHVRKGTYQFEVLSEVLFTVLPLNTIKYSFCMELNQGNNDGK